MAAFPSPSFYQAVLYKMRILKSSLCRIKLAALIAAVGFTPQMFHISGVQGTVLSLTDLRGDCTLSINPAVHKCNKF